MQCSVAEDHLPAIFYCLVEPPLIPKKAAYSAKANCRPLSMVMALGILHQANREKRMPMKTNAVTDPVVTTSSTWKFQVGIEVIHHHEYVQPRMNWREKMY